MELDHLYHVKQLFYQASYKACIAEASSSHGLPGALYAARSHLATYPPNFSAAKDVLSSHTDAPAAKAVLALAGYLADEDKPARVDEVRDLVIEAEGADEEGEESLEGVIRVVAGTVFVLEGENEEAVATLTEGRAKEDLECHALLVQLLISLDRRDLAQTIFNQAKKIGNDSTLVQAMEAWIGLKTGGRPLHQAYYYFEELYQLPSGRTPSVIASHAGAHLLLGHIDEAKADISEAGQVEGGAQNPDVLSVGTSLRLEGYAEKLTAAAPAHPHVAELAKLSKEFDEAASKFAIAA